MFREIEKKNVIMKGGTRFVSSPSEDEEATKVLALHYVLATTRVVVNVENLKTDSILKEEIEKIAGARVELSLEEVDVVYDRAFARLESLKK